MKKIVYLCFVFGLMVVLLLSGCKTSAKDTLTGDLPGILQSVYSGANTRLGAGNALPETFDEPVTNETGTSMLGLTSVQFDQYVTEAYGSVAMMMTSPYQVALVKCTDAAAAAEVKQLIATGFDSYKWVCVAPEVCYVIDSGSYVLLVAGYPDAADAILESFKEVAKNNVGEQKVFFERQDESDVETL